MENKNYFTHDYRSRLDAKLLKVRMKHGMAGFGVYWALVEMLHEGNGSITADVETIAYDLRCDVSIITDVISICFDYEGDVISCERVVENLKIRKEKKELKSKKGKDAANMRWEKYRNSMRDDTKPMRDVWVDDAFGIDDPYQLDALVMRNDAKEKEKEKEKVKDQKNSISNSIDSRSVSQVKGKKSFAELFYENSNIDPLDYIKS